MIFISDGIKNTETNSMFVEAPVQIIYASRTHSQLAQAVKEFKATAYKYCVYCFKGLQKPFFQSNEDNCAWLTRSTLYSSGSQEYREQFR